MRHLKHHGRHLVTRGEGCCAVAGWLRKLERLQSGEHESSGLDTGTKAPLSMAGEILCFKFANTVHIVASVSL